MPPAPTPSSEFLLPGGRPTALGTALVQEGNYLSTPITSTSAILLTSAPDESPLPTVEELRDQFREWNHGTLVPHSLYVEYSKFCWQPSAAILPAKSQELSFVTSNSPFSLYLAVSLIKAQRHHNCWFDGKIQLACTSGCVMWACFPTNDLGALAFIGLLCLASCGISCRTFRVI